MTDLLSDRALLMLERRKRDGKPFFMSLHIRSRRLPQFNDAAAD